MTGFEACSVAATHELIISYTLSLFSFIVYGRLSAKKLGHIPGGFFWNDTISTLTS